MEIQNQKQHDSCLPLGIKIIYENKLVCLSNSETWFLCFGGVAHEVVATLFILTLHLPLNVPFLVGADNYLKKNKNFFIICLELKNGGKYIV